MVNNNQSTTIKLSKQNIRQIESLIDTICDQLFVNDTYYGNILIAVTELFGLLSSNNENKSVSIKYFSNYESMTISFHPVDFQTIDLFNSNIDINNIDNHQENSTAFLINSIVDNLSIEEETINLEFDISALHNDIYNQRKALLKNYFNKTKVPDKVKYHND